MALTEVQIVIKAADAKPVARLIAACLDLAPFIEKTYSITQQPEYQAFETALHPFRAKALP